MVFYYGRHFESAAIGTQIVPVQCDACGYKYYYELARIGSGSASAHYGIGSARADRVASEQSAGDLDERLNFEAELVPCPECHWINEDLIAGYRKGRYRGWVRFAVSVAILGSYFSIFSPRFRLIGPVLSAVLAGLIVLIRNLLRNMINPNRDHPLPPKVPRGSPPALIVNNDTGQLEPATRSCVFDEEVSDWIDFQIGRNTLPMRCSECLHPAAPWTPYQRTVLPAVTLAVPFCAPCGRRWKWRKWRIAAITFGSVLALWFPMLVVTNFHAGAFLTLCAGWAPLAFLIAVAVTYPLSRPVRVKVVDKSRGALRLRFRNRKYHQLVSLANEN